MNLSRFDWEDGNNLEKITIWVSDPMKQLLEIYNEYTEENNDKRLTFFYYALREKLEELDEVIYKWLDQRRVVDKKIASV